MFEWFGGVQNVIQILIPLFAIGVSLIAPKVTTTSGSRRYFLPAFASWFGYNVLIGLEQGTLLSFPHPLGLISAVLLLVGFTGLMFRGLFAAWRERQTADPSG